MSMEAINWALEMPGTPTQKHVLLVLANHANEDGHAFPSIDRLRHATGLSDRAVRTARLALIEAGLLEKCSKFTRNGVRLRLELDAGKAAHHAGKSAPNAKNAASPATQKQAAHPAGHPASPAKKMAPNAGPHNHQLTTTNHQSIPPNPPAKKSAGKFELPDWVPLDAWQGWLEMRRGKKCPATQRALELAVCDLSKLRAEGNDPGAVLDQSTQRGWRGLFPLKNQQNGGNVVPFGQPKPRPSNPFEGFADGFDVEIPDLTPDQKAAWLRYGGQP